MTQDANLDTADLAAAEPSHLGGGRDRDTAAAQGGPDDTPLTIGEVAREFGMTLRALRFYESKQLITPERHGAVRLYRRTDRERITVILTGRRLGFTLAEIRDLVGRSGGNRFTLTREKCVEQITLLEQRKRGIEVAIAELRQIYTSFYKSLLEGTRSH